MRFKKTFFTLVSLIVCVAPILGTIFSHSASNQILTDKNVVNNSSLSSRNVDLKLTGRPTTIKNRIVVNSQNINFAQSYLNWEYFNNFTSPIETKIKNLLKDSAFESLPIATTENDITIINGYVDNYDGSIFVKFQLNKYYDNSGNLNTTEPLNGEISIVGFKTSSATIIPNQIMTNLSQAITTVNIDELMPLAKTNLINGVTNANVILDSNSRIEYPGLEKITYNVSVDSYLKDAYINEETLDISFDENLALADGYKKIGYYCSPKSPAIVVDGNIPLTKDDVSFYGEFLSTKPTTYIKEGDFIVPNDYINKKASEIFGNENQIKSILDKLKVLINMYPSTSPQIPTTIVISEKQFNDLTGTLTLKTKLAGSVYYENNMYEYPSTGSSNLSGFNRVFNLHITGFSTVKATTIVQTIDISNTELGKNQASQFPNTTTNRSLLIRTLGSLNNNPAAPIFEGIPNNDLLPPPNPQWFSDVNISFLGYTRPGNNLTYVGIPNDLTGELKITIYINWYFDHKNGALITRTNGNNEPPLELTTTLVGFSKINDDFARINTRVATLDWDWILPQEVFTILSRDNITDFIDTWGIINPSKRPPNAVIKITDNNEIESWNDPESSNRSGNLMLHYEFQNFVDPTDGILNTVPSQGKILLANFLSVLPTELNDNVPLEFFSLNAPFVTDVTNNSKNPVDILKDFLIKARPGRGDLVNIANLFQRRNNSNNSIPAAITSFINQPPNSLPPDADFNKFFEIKTIVDSDSKIGTLSAEIDLKTYYANDEKATLISPDSNVFLTKQITFLGFTPARPTDVNYLVNIRNAAKPEDYQHYPSELSANPEKLKEIVFENKSLFFRNIPEIFGKNDFNLSNIVASNTEGSITFAITITRNYFNSDSVFVSANIDKKFDNININGFLSSQPTEVKNIVNISSLFYDNLPLNEGMQLESFEKMKIADDSSITGYQKNIEYLIEHNPSAFITNPYKIDLIGSLSYFEVTNYVPSFSEGRLKFNLQLKYYFSENDSIPTEPPEPASKVYNIELTGFATNNATSAVSRFSLEQYPEINQYTPQYLVDNPTILKDYIFGNKGKNILPNFTLINLLFSNLPLKWTQTDNNTINQYYTELNSNITVERVISSASSIRVTFTLNDVFVTANNGVLIANNTFVIDFEGLNNISGTSINKTWDLNSIITQWSDGKAPAEQQISNMPSTEIVTWLNEQIFGTGSNRRYETFITNLVISNPPSIVSIDDSSLVVNPKTGTIEIKVIVQNYYNTDGTINNIGTISETVSMNGFATENSTFAKTRSTSIYESAIISSEILFGTATILPSEFISGTVNVNETLKNNINSSKNPPSNPQLPKIDIMNKLFENIIENDLNPANNTQISGIEITGFNDITGSISFNASIINYYDNNGKLERTSPSTPYPFTINGLYNANPTNISQTNVFINDASSNGVFGLGLGDLNYLTPKEFLDNYNNILVKNNQDFERYIATGITTKGVTYYPFAIPSNASFKDSVDLINIDNNKFGTKGALTARIDSNSYNINEKEGILNFSVDFANVWLEDNKEITINGTTTKIIGRSLNAVTDDTYNITKQLSINGFKQSNVVDNTLIIASIVTGSVGLIIIFAIAIYFLVRKIRTYKG